MSKTLSKEIKAVVSHDFYPQSYMESALESDTKGLGVDGTKLIALRPQYQNMISDLEDKRQAPGAVSEIRNELIQLVYKALGYYEILALQDRETFSFEAKPGQHFNLPIERAFALKNSREAELWLLKHLPTSTDQEAELFPSQISSAEAKNSEVTQTISWSDVISNIFDSDSFSVDYLIVSTGTNLYITEKGKWQDDGEVYLQIDLTELYSVNDSDLYRLAEVLTSVKAFPIDSAEYFHNTIAQNAHKKASEVTKALRETVRESIETIANEILANHYKKPLSTWKKRDLANPTDRKLCASELQDQTLRYIYRMLFFLFAESQGRNTLPVESEGYLKGYSIEKLRDFEGKPIAVAHGRQGENNFIQRTLERTTKIYFCGYHNNKIWEEDKHTEENVQKTDALGFSFPSLGSDLFDSGRTPLFNEAVLSDRAMQTVIEKLSLARVGSGKKARTHRVHYAGLGINQLGAVYEGLLSLNPDILTEKVALLVQDQKDHAPRVIPFTKRNEVNQEQLQKEENGNVISKEKGTFVLTPVGLERKFSASFYTAEVLTRFVAKEAVDQILKDDKSLKKMEGLKILEPAMGSGAFLNAVVDELAPKMAEEYRRQDQKENTLSRRTFDYYKAKAKNHLMRNCVYGVDLNSTAVELAKISLWLNCLHEDGNLPFLDFKLRCGNSLVGAWLNRFRTKDDLPHFLLPHPNALNPHLEGLVLGDKKRPFIEDDKLREKLKALKQEYQTFGENEKTQKRLINLTSRIKKLYQNHKIAREDYQEKVAKLLNAADKEKAFEEFVQKNTSYNQLRAMMDLWCSLWFWPHHEIKKLPDTEEYLQALEWCAETPLAYGANQIAQIEESGLSLLSIARDVSFKTKFFHWDLEFCEVLDTGGFDLCIGNPPWAPIRWEEEDFFELYEAGTGALTGDAKQKHGVYGKLLDKNPVWCTYYKNEKTRVAGLTEFLGNSLTYPFHDSSNTNTYKYFYQRFHQLSRNSGIQSMIAQDGILTDDGCLEMRPTYLRELEALFHFKNELKLFEDVHNEVNFIVSHLRRGKTQCGFYSLQNLYHPSTVDLCRSESQSAPYRGMKDEEGGFELRGHPNRFVKIDQGLLETLALFSPGRSWDTMILPIIHGGTELKTLNALAKHPNKIQETNFYYWRRFDESVAPKKQLIVRKPGFADPISRAVLTGPNIYVGNPANKSVNPTAKNNRDFSEVDLTSVSREYFPATVYKLTDIGFRSEEYNSKTAWGSAFKDQYRLLVRRMVSTTGARTLAAAIIPPGPTHIDASSSLAFKSTSELLVIAGVFNSLIIDFLMRSISGGTIGKDILSMAPYFIDNPTQRKLILGLNVRTLRLCAISNHYADIWKSAYNIDFNLISVPSSFEPEVPYSKLNGKWEMGTCIRDIQQREQALCEIDAIVAILFGFEKQVLLDLYRSQFGVLQKNWQDLPGQLVDKSDPKERPWFPRYEAMSKAYDGFISLLKGEKPKSDKSTGEKRKNDAAKVA